ncbi:hypothetical protein [Endozoicomonas sp. SCSIO W0465]|uniref:hypothetical protein n=1 Tax=Endozoicomonas sp. SCSIO W0465 TaxID=2918516 RepID=UPI0020757A6F|nr:hypothetical protein [Endozoicomonas sp. SCSIO W0465]USE34843.1 hypothetical protein MJO57_22330 [Endozoicomonas sp. SCSIO W0465]
MSPRPLLPLLLLNHCRATTESAISRDIGFNPLAGKTGELKRDSDPGYVKRNSLQKNAGVGQRVDAGKMSHQHQLGGTQRYQ